MKKEIKVCDNIFGTYMGYLDFDGERGFDVREDNRYLLEDILLENKDPICLESDYKHRKDI